MYVCVCVAGGGYEALSIIKWGVNCQSSVGVLHTLLRAWFDDPYAELS
jgi:hypothetical protein